MIRLIACFLLLLVGGTASLFAEEKMWSALTHQQQSELLQGKVVEIEEDVPESVWPRFIVYQMVKASPADVAAVFWNCEQASEYVPNCISVRIVNQPHPWIVDAEYTLEMPFFLSNEVYVSRNELRRHSPSEYEISWHVLHSSYSKSAVGNLLLQEHDGKTLLRYTNLVVPFGKIAGLLRSSASKHVLESVQSLVKRVLWELDRSPSLLEKQLGSLEHSLEKSSL